MGLSVGIVGLPNVGKSTIFNALTAAGAQSANYPFCTIEPNVGIVPVTDPRLDRIARFAESKQIVYTDLEVVDIYGAEAGNMALRTLARGGVFLAGGIAGKNVHYFTDGRFVRAFTRKGRFAPLLAEIPVDVIVNAKVGLLGAAEAALRLASKG